MQISRVSVWRWLQGVSWLLGVGIFVSLLIVPRVGLMLFWNVLIPIAPALLVLAPGLWRNVCPLATTTLLPRHLQLSKRRRMSVETQGVLGLIAVIVLYIIVPLRHAIFNSSGLATAYLLAGAALVGILMSFVFEWKSAWCSSLCPIHPVEKLYGVNPTVRFNNAHCKSCMNCVAPCPDSVTHIEARSSRKSSIHRLSVWLLAGGLPGFIWGWFQVSDNAGAHTLATIYGMPLLGMSITLFVFLSLNFIFRNQRDFLLKLAAAASVSCYYWFRIPALFGFHPGSADGLLIDLHEQLPDWTVSLAVALITLFFFFWILKQGRQTSWLIRPAMLRRK